MSFAQIAQPATGDASHPSRESVTADLRFALRVAGPRDAAALAHLEREAFPTIIASTPFRQELRRDSAYYVVADDLSVASPVGKGTQGDRGRNSLLRRIMDFVAPKSSAPPPADLEQHPAAGMVGLWFMVDECHIVSIATARNARRLGLGERLLIAAFEEAFKRGSRMVTLEVRASNVVAKSLYQKYGLREEGVRKRYYSDNHEDAVIMTTPDIQSPAFQEQFWELVRRHYNKWGVST